MNWLIGIMGLAIVGLLAFGLFDERGRSKEQAKAMLEQQDRLDRSQHNERVYSDQIQAGQRAAMLSMLTGYQADYTALVRLRSTPLIVQQREVKERLIGAGLLTRADTGLTAGSGRVVYDSVQHGAITLAIEQRDRYRISDSTSSAAVGGLVKVLADTSQAYQRLLGDVAVWSTTGGLFSGKNRRLKRAYQRETRVK